jgi:hypothetical protein
LADLAFFNHFHELLGKKENEIVGLRDCFREKKYEGSNHIIIQRRFLYTKLNAFICKITYLGFHCDGFGGFDGCHLEE